ncbi:ATP-dependent DNA helicase [Candidatus Woesearchaeota archaeon]|jgi:DNA excision repair protein ERCC-2|nr:ATP-dependent DNA helicase [Candidatus Woesearchaeota archaeon]
MTNNNEDLGEKFLFPFDQVREIQIELLEKISETINTGNNLIAHAPTGLGKSAAAIAPALKYALDNNKKIFFLTSRHTQHTIAIDTLRAIKNKFNIPFVSVDMIGKKHMCSVDGIENLYSNEFSEYCKKQREENKCEFYLKTKKNNKLTPEATVVLNELKQRSPLHVEDFKEFCKDNELCPYELAAIMAKDASVIVSDYYYIFNPKVRDLFFARAQISLEDCIIIVDEAHNLPDRIRSLLTSQISNVVIKRSIKEARKIEYSDTVRRLVKVQEALLNVSEKLHSSEKLVPKNDFISLLSSLNSESGEIENYETLIEDFESTAELVREKEKRSSIGTVAKFIDAWRGEDEGFVRIASHKFFKNESLISLSYRCLDPSLVSREVIENAHSVILMSGTLNPTSMFKNILGFPKESFEESYPSPFPEDNRLNMIIPETTTKFSMRSEAQFERMGEICADITNLVKGNCAIFFPSYSLRNSVYKTFNKISKKTTFLEDSSMTKEDKSDLLERFKDYKNIGAVLLGVMSGSFSEGIDLPGDYLKCVIVVGLPLGQPDIETKKLIDYYDQKFGQGWDYGYVAPAFSKCLQSAGRCIRSGTDRGLVVFLDARYVWSNYAKHFPRDWNIQVTRDFEPPIKDFFNQK